MEKRSKERRKRREIPAKATNKDEWFIGKEKGTKRAWVE